MIRGSNSIRSCWSSLEADAPVSGRVDRDLDYSGCVQQRSRQVGSAINQDLVGKIQSLDLLDESGLVDLGLSGRLMVVIVVSDQRPVVWRRFRC